MCSADRHVTGHVINGSGRSIVGTWSVHGRLIQKLLVDHQWSVLWAVRSDLRSAGGRVVGPEW
jgi:hypothetical protein